jgi:3-deoxy-D-manno-octulosonic-acid transferase
MRRTLSCVRHIAAQTEGDRMRFMQLGVPPAGVSVTGNLKYDVELPADLAVRAAQLRARLAGRRPVWVAASTHEGEEAALLAAHAELLQQHPHAVLLLVPRHPERAAALARQCHSQDLECRLSSEVSVAGVPVLLVDQLGLLVYCYAVADAAFIGGSLVDRGGHNPIEALLAGTPVISGPYTANFADVYRQLQEAGAVQRVTAPAQLAGQLRGWFNDAAARTRAVAAGRHVVEGNRGALAQVLAVLAPERQAGNRAG